MTSPHPNEVLPILPVNSVTYLPGCSASPPNKRLKLTAPRLSEEWRLCADRFRGRLKGRGAGGGRRLQLRRIPLGGAPMSSMWRVRRVL